MLSLQIRVKLPLASANIDLPITMFSISKNSFNRSRVTSLFWLFEIKPFNWWFLFKTRQASSPITIVFGSCAILDETAFFASSITPCGSDTFQLKQDFPDKIFLLLESYLERSCAKSAHSFSCFNCKPFVTTLV